MGVVGLRVCLLSLLTPTHSQEHAHTQPRGRLVWAPQPQPLPSPSPALIPAVMNPCWVASSVCLGPFSSDICQLVPAYLLQQMPLISPPTPTLLVMVMRMPFHHKCPLSLTDVEAEGGTQIPDLVFLQSYRLWSLMSCFKEATEDSLKVSQLTYDQSRQLSSTSVIQKGTIH